MDRRRDEGVLAARSRRGCQTRSVCEYHHLGRSAGFRGRTSIRCAQEPLLLPARPVSRWILQCRFQLEELDELGQEKCSRCWAVVYYPHVAAAYWSLYRIARHSKGLTTKRDWQWYLEHAYQTTIAMHTQAPYYTQFGQMEGTIFVILLTDLKAEGWNDRAAKLEAWMHERADHWKSEAYPFGSEMPWDSTGQEEVYAW